MYPEPKPVTSRSWPRQPDCEARCSRLLPRSLRKVLRRAGSDRRVELRLGSRAAGNDDTLPNGILAQAEELLQRDHELDAEEPVLAKLVQRSREARASGADAIFSLARFWLR